MQEWELPIASLHRNRPAIMAGGAVRMEYVEWRLLGSVADIVYQGGLQHAS